MAKQLVITIDNHKIMNHLIKSSYFFIFLILVSCQISHPEKRKYKCIKKTNKENFYQDLDINIKEDSIYHKYSFKIDDYLEVFEDTLVKKKNKFIINNKCVLRTDKGKGDRYKTLSPWWKNSSVEVEIIQSDYDTVINSINLKGCCIYKIVCNNDAHVFCSNDILILDKKREIIFGRIYLDKDQVIRGSKLISRIIKE